MLIDTKNMTDLFIAQAKELPKSMKLVLSAMPTGFEGWFRAWSMGVLCEMGAQPEKLRPRHHFKDGKEADLKVETEEGAIVFEIMCFVSGKDGQKKKRFPTQLEHLENAVRAGEIRQCIALATFVGYSDEQINRLLNRFFGSRSWKGEGPVGLFTDGQRLLHIFIASFNVK